MLNTAALHVVIAVAVLMFGVFGQTAYAARGGDQTPIAFKSQPAAQLVGAVAAFETLLADLKQALGPDQIGTRFLPLPSAQAFAVSGCHFLRLPESPSQKHCEHVVKRATYSSRVKILRRARTDAKFFVALPVSQNEMAGLFGSSRTAIQPNRLKPRSPFKAMYAITSRMLN